MSQDLLSIAKASRQEVIDKDVSEKEARKRQRRKRQENAEHAYEIFKDTLSQLLGIGSFKIDKSYLSNAGPCVVITDSAGRRFEIHYEKAVNIDGTHFGKGDCDYHINGQWGNDKWLTYSVAISEKTVAQQLGRWLGQIETAKLA